MRLAKNTGEDGYIPGGGGSCTFRSRTQLGKNKTLWRCSTVQTLPEAQRTQDIESKTWIISKSWNECKLQFSTLSLPPLPGNHLSHFVHLPVILLAHHHLNDNRYLPMVQQHIFSPTWSQLTSTPAPIFRATPVPPPCLSLIHIWRCRRSTLCRSRWSPYH